MEFFSNLARRETWSIAADLNHIFHPTESLTQEQIAHQDPSFWDRLGGSILFALSLIAVIPGCFYLYWASRKVEQIDENDLENATGRVNVIFEDNRPALEQLKNSGEEIIKQESTTSPRLLSGQGEVTSNTTRSDTISINLTNPSKKDASPYSDDSKQLGATLLAFGSFRNRSTAQKELKALEEKGLLTSKMRSLLLTEAIEHNQIEKVELLLGKFSNYAKQQFEKQSDEAIQQSLSNQHLFELLSPIPLHKVNSVAMMQKLISFNISLDEPVDDKGNTALHLVSDKEIAKIILNSGGQLNTNKEGDNPFHTCQNIEVFQMLETEGETEKHVIIHLRDAENNYKESPAITLLSRLITLIKIRDESQTIEEWDVLSKQIQDLKKLSEYILAKKETKISPNNRNGFSAFHLCALTGDAFLLKEAEKCNHYHHDFKSNSFLLPESKGLYNNEIVVIENRSYTCCDLAIQRMFLLKERLKAEINNEISKKLQDEIADLRHIYLVYK